MSGKRIAVAYDCLFPYSTGGGERQYRAFAEEMVARGHRVEYLTARSWSSPPDAPFDAVAVSGRLALHGPDGVRSGAAALRYASGLWWRLLRSRRQYDAVIVSALPPLNVFAARAAMLGARTPIAVDYLEVWSRQQWIDYLGGLKGRLAWLTQRAAIAMSPLATCHSRLNGERLTEEGLRSKPLVSPGLISGVVASTVRVSSSDAPFVLYVGRHIPDKRVETLPAAVDYARRTIPDLRLVILGEGPSSPSIRATIGALGSPEWITMQGFVGEDELAALMGAASCVVNPSKREGYGLVVVEAAGHGTPVVLVDHPANASTELVERGVNGVVAANESAETLGDAIAEAVTSGASLRISTHEWFQDALKTRTVERTVARILAALGLDA